MTHQTSLQIPRLSSPELNATLTRIEEWDPSNGQGPIQGIFSVFAVKNDPQGQPRPQLRLSSSTTIDTTADTRFTGYNYEQDSSALPPDISGSVTVPLPHHDDQPSDRGASFANSERQSPDNYLLKRQNEQLPTRHLEALLMPSNQKRLIHHWVTFTSRKLVLLDEPHNPCRTMMLPMALQGLVSSSADSNANVAIFHAICAAAAYNLYELGNQSAQQDLSLALRHDQQAIHHLRSNLDRDDAHKDQSFAMAIMACIAVEAISGTTERWRTHVSGGLAYLAKLHAQGMEPAVLFAFQRHMVLMAILCDFNVADDLKAFLTNDAATMDLEFTFPYYGVSRTFLQAHDRMNTLSMTRETAAQANRSPEFEKELDLFELQLYLDFPSLPPPSLATTNKLFSVAVHHMAKIFYYAGLVFFQRSIRMASVDSVQALVELGVGELETLEQVGQGQLGCMMLWPVLVLAAECGTLEMQKRMRAWFLDQRKLGFRNLVVLEDLTSTVWRTRIESAAHGANVDWRDIIIQDKFDVFRL